MIDRIATDESTEQKTLSEREQKIYNMICENLHLLVEQVMVELQVPFMIKRLQHGHRNETNSIID